MQRFTQLLITLESTPYEGERLAALERYFSEAPPPDAAWGLTFLLGWRPPRAISAAELRRWATEASGYPEWLVEAAIEASGELSEAAALLLADDASDVPPPLRELAGERLPQLKNLSEFERRELMLRTWGELSAAGRRLWNRMAAGELRPAIPHVLVVRALATVAEVPPFEIALRLEELKLWHGRLARESNHGRDARATIFSETDFGRLMLREIDPRSPGGPYPFVMASPLETPPESLGARRDWQAEWHWDGLRAQLVHRRGQVHLWSCAGKVLSDAYPEIAQAALALPDGTVLDGVLSPQSALRSPHFLVFDLLEENGADLRDRPLGERRARLENLMSPHSALHAPHSLIISSIHSASDWPTLDALRPQARARGARGLILKRLNSTYCDNCDGGVWLQWPAEPFTIDAVLLNARRGAAGWYSDLSLGVWQGNELVPVARGECPLCEEELEELDGFIRANTQERFGPVRSVPASLVFEVAFEAAERSPRHKAGLKLRGARILRWRRETNPAEAATLDALTALL